MLLRLFLGQADLGEALLKLLLEALLLLPRRLGGGHGLLSAAWEEDLLRELLCLLLRLIVIDAGLGDRLAQVVLEDFLGAPPKFVLLLAVLSVILLHFLADLTGLLPGLLLGKPALEEALLDLPFEVLRRRLAGRVVLLPHLTGGAIRGLVGLVVLLGGRR